MIRCAVVGDPIAHSLSPVLHRAGHTHLGVDAGYEAVLVAEGELAARLDGDLAFLNGVSVTAPLKREALALAHDATPLARRVGAANTLTFADRQVHADNTDVPGAIAAIRERTDRSLDRAVVLGGGATAGSMGVALCELGVTEVTVLARDAARATEAAAVTEAAGAQVHIGALSADAEAGSLLEEPDIVVSTIPPAAQEPLERVLRGWCESETVVFEVTYDPWPTPLARLAQQHGTVLVEGLDLLAHQAVLQLEAFTGRTVPVEVLREAGRAELRRRGRGA